MADPPGVAAPHRIADVEPHGFPRRDHARRQLVDVQRNRHAGILRVQEINHRHVERKGDRKHISVSSGWTRLNDTTRVIERWPLRSQPRICANTASGGPAPAPKGVFIEWLGPVHRIGLRCPTCEQLIPQRYGRVELLPSPPPTTACLNPEEGLSVAVGQGPRPIPPPFPAEWAIPHSDVIVSSRQLHMFRGGARCDLRDHVARSARSREG